MTAPHFPALRAPKSASAHFRSESAMYTFLHGVYEIAFDTCCINVAGIRAYRVKDRLNERRLGVSDTGMCFTRSLVRVIYVSFPDLSLRVFLGLISSKSTLFYVVFILFLQEKGLAIFPLPGFPRYRWNSCLQIFSNLSDMFNTLCQL